MENPIDRRQFVAAAAGLMAGCAAVEEPTKSERCPCEKCECDPCECFCSSAKAPECGCLMCERRANATYITNISWCARCGNDHEDAVFKKMDRPHNDLGDTSYTHWAACPTNGQPILLTFFCDCKSNNDVRCQERRSKC